MTASLYIHVPFCAPHAAPPGGVGRCDYCDFYSVPLSEKYHSLLDTFTGAVLGDIKKQFDVFGVNYVPAVYIGGGTPSALGPRRMEQLLAGLKDLWKAMEKPPGEFSAEANPESADRAFLQACASGGVNRISLGVQTFHEPSRRAVHRPGGGALAEERLALAAEYFPGALSVDLMTGLPFQTEAIVRADIERALAFRPAHISLYSLCLEPDTPLGKQAARYGAAALSLPCGDEADNLWITGRDCLEEAGYTQYEVSNFALPGKFCAHNIRYWRMENWLGAGPAASGTIINDETGTGSRLTYPADIDLYLTASEDNRAHEEKLDTADLIRESLLMGFRYRKGPDEFSFKRRFGRGIEDCIPGTISRWRDRGFFDTEQSGLAPSRNGLLFLNSFLRDAFAEMECL